MAEMKKKKSKVIIIVVVSLVVVVLAVAGIIFKLNYVSDTDRSNALTKAAKSYYAKYMSGVIGLDEAEITVGMLKTANKQNNTNYDLSLLDKCKDSTEITFTLSKGKIVNQKVKLNCN